MPYGQDRLIPIWNATLVHPWFHKGETEPRAPTSDDKVAVLSDAFYEGINANRIAVEREVVALLSNSPGTLDLYVRVVWKTWSLSAHSVRIPLFTPGGLADQLGSIEYSADCFFRRKLSHWLGQVKKLWPDCPDQISRDGQSLLLFASKKVPAISTF
jgi:hypothetical protein